jgi:predicted metalloprotease
MRWQGGRESGNVEDRRGMRMIPGGGAGLGIGGMLLVLAFSLITGKDPRALLQLLSTVQESVPQEEGPPAGPPQDELGKFASVVLADTETTWEQVFTAGGSHYEAPKLVLFSRAVRSACGTASSAVGPFYCPNDRKVYLDVTFFDELARRFGAPGDFAQAYVIAHEVGHHVQNLLGISDQVHNAQQRATSEAEANALSVRLELQADCLAGVWAKHTQIELEAGDIEEGLRAAAAIGDDRLQKMTQGEVQPDSFTHGSSEQRVGALRRGVQTGDVNSCKT